MPLQEVDLKLFPHPFDRVEQECQRVSRVIVWPKSYDLRHYPHGHALTEATRQPANVIGHCLRRAQQFGASPCVSWNRNSHTSRSIVYENQFIKVVIPAGTYGDSFYDMDTWAKAVRADQVVEEQIISKDRWVVDGEHRETWNSVLQKVVTQLHERCDSLCAAMIEEIKAATVHRAMEREHNLVQASARVADMADAVI